MLLKIHPENPAERTVKTVIECLKDGGLVIYPTDTVYGMGCDIMNGKALEKLALIKGVKLEKAKFSFICYDLSHISDFTKPLSNTIFKIIKRNTPGPFTFILNANNNAPKMMQTKKKTVGIRVPDNNIPRLLVQQLGNPIVNTSIYSDDDIVEYGTDPELIHEKYENLVDIVIDGGYGGLEPSTILDCTTDEITIIRQGKGILD